jgi:bifunctional DNA-binding transcriptional regulator/antitoxin component of YhaV-PrlF toxin-antitoxin module
MAKVQQTVRRVTGKGQVTLPALWRARMNSDSIVFVERGNVLEVHAADVTSGEKVLYDAVRDTGGTGIPVKDLIGALKKDLTKK